MEQLFKSNTYVIGDIHGRLKQLIDALTIVNFDYENDRLISLGDLCDRGEDSCGVVEELLKIKNLIAVRGNHDEWFLEFLNEEKSKRMLRVDVGWLRQGGFETINSYKNKEDLLEKHKEFYKSQLPYFLENNILFVHGGFDPKIPINEQHESEFYWNRDLVEKMMSCSDGIKLKTADDFDMIFIGHTPTYNWLEDIKGVGRRKITKPIFRGGIWNLDTGCGKGEEYKLTIMNLETQEYFQA